MHGLSFSLAPFASRIARDIDFREYRRNNCSLFNDLDLSTRVRSRCIRKEVFSLSLSLGLLFPVAYSRVTSGLFRVVKCNAEMSRWDLIPAPASVRGIFNLYDEAKQLSY